MARTIAAARARKQGADATAWSTAATPLHRIAKRLRMVPTIAEGAARKRALPARQEPAAGARRVEPGPIVQAFRGEPVIAVARLPMCAAVAGVCRKAPAIAPATSRKHAAAVFLCQKAPAIALAV